MTGFRLSHVSVHRFLNSLPPGSCKGTPFVCIYLPVEMKSHERRVWAIAVHVALSGALWGLDTGMLKIMRSHSKVKSSLTLLSPIRVNWSHHPDDPIQGLYRISIDNKARPLRFLLLARSCHLRSRQWARLRPGVSQVWYPLRRNHHHDRSGHVRMLSKSSVFVRRESHHRSWCRAVHIDCGGVSGRDPSCRSTRSDR